MAETTANMLGELAARALPMAAARLGFVSPEPGTRIPALHDTCPCHKGPDGYGREGYHLRRYTDRDVDREIDRALAALPRDLTDADRATVERATRQASSRYLGLPVAYERCKWWEEQQRRIIEARRAKQGKSSADDFMGDDL